MSETLRTVRLYGVAGNLFGRTHRLAVSSTREAIRALCAIVPGFEKFLMNAKDNGLTFAVFSGRRNLDEESLSHPVGADEIRIAPILIGSKSGGIFQTILGAALVVVGAVASAYGQAWGANVIALGASMALGGIVQMLSPQTSTSSNDAGSGASYYFGGAVNSSAQGDPVPLAYGYMRVGSKVGSSGIYAEDQV